MSDKLQQHAQAALSDEQIKRIAHGLYLADVLIDVVPTRAQNSDNDSLAFLGQLVNGNDGAYHHIAIAKREFFAHFHLEETCSQPRAAAPLQPSQPRIITKENAKEYLEELLWDFIGTSGNFPEIATDPRTWQHVMVYAPATPAIQQEGAALDERAAFEAWCYDKHTIGGPERGLKEYANSGTQAAWVVWQARAALTKGQK
jgi:hypothetical protein